jgi:hypothetical protein
VSATFDHEVAVEHLGGGRYEATASERWAAYVGPNGGYLAALVLSACSDMVHDPARHPRSISLHYLEPPAFGRVEIQVTVERSGRVMTQLGARLSQGGRPKVVALAAFSGDRPGPAFQDATLPPVGPPVGPSAPGARPLEIVQVHGGPPGSGEPADIGAWVRLAEPRPLDALLAAVYVDGWHSALSVRLPEPLPSPTADLTVHFRHPLPPAGTGPDTRYFLRLASRVAAGGFVEEDAELWSPDGLLLVQSRQLEVVFRR